ncbi:hypothetical protein C1645_877066 [Glomus cerebriforme]|uniref:Uncharacterized protein n=1 Tax=Glomus cerebriforme TaxID=658196 RepID=A0A397SSB4_9GLOM|nr:hypothetical protein C1645_877066 [Glomus cerebriforme]
MSLELPVIFGLIEQKDTGIYLCAILDFLIKLHNEFLDDIAKIPIGKCESLKCLEDSSWNNLTPKSYFIVSKKVTQAQDNNFINYKWHDRILKYSQRNLEMKDVSYIFDLQKIEKKLTKKLVLNKVYFEMEDNQFYLKNFSFKYELFHNSPRILFDIKKILQQEPIPTDRRLIILANFQPLNALYNSNPIDLSELLFIFEAILCFIKELSIKNNNVFILDLVDKWLKLARYNITPIDILKEFSLKHIIAFYELIEEQAANSIIHDIDDKFKIPLTQQMKDSINNIVYYDQENSNQQLISAKEFAFALKRFIYRFLLIDSNMDNLSLNTYFLDFTLNLWSDVKEDLVEKLFPTCLFVSHAYNSYIFIIDEIEKAMNERQNNRRNLAKINKFKKFKG